MVKLKHQSPFFFPVLFLFQTSRKGVPFLPPEPQEDLTASLTGYKEAKGQDDFEMGMTSTNKGDL
jgi:hypothetical protein